MLSAVAAHAVVRLLHSPLRVWVRWKDRASSRALVVEEGRNLGQVGHCYLTGDKGIPQVQGAEFESVSAPADRSELAGQYPMVAFVRSGYPMWIRLDANETNRSRRIVRSNANLRSDSNSRAKQDRLAKSSA